MIRDGDDWRAVSWDDALARCEELLHGVLARHGKGALAKNFLKNVFEIQIVVLNKDLDF